MGILPFGSSCRKTKRSSGSLMSLCGGLFACGGLMSYCVCLFDCRGFKYIRHGFVFVCILSVEV